MLPRADQEVSRKKREAPLRVGEVQTQDNSKQQRRHEHASRRREWTSRNGSDDGARGWILRG
jgi:hypothetical protein